MKYHNIQDDTEWFYDRLFSQPIEGLRQQTITTYYEAGGNFHKETITRNYYGINDYQDTVKSEVF